MNVETITMDPSVARKAYLEYRARCRDHREKRRQRLDKKRDLLEREDDQMRAAYRALSQGHRILNLRQVISGAGVDDKHQPKLAVATAGTEFCFFSFHWNKGYCFMHNDRFPQLSAYRLPQSAFPDQTRRIGTLRAVVPAIPSQFRPAGNLGDYFILWEAEWTPIAPADPLLLKRIDGDMFAVLAQWDLSPVEKMVLEGRFSR